MTYHTFTTPEIFFAKLIQRYKPPVGIVVPIKDLKSIQIRVGIVLMKWMEELHENDLTDQLLSSVKMFLERHIKKNSPSMYQKVEATISRKLKGTEIRVCIG